MEVRVKLLRSWLRRVPGDIVCLPPGVAAALVGRPGGWAEYYKPPPTKEQRRAKRGSAKKRGAD